MISPSNSINTMKSHEDKVFERLFGNSGSQTAISPKGRLVHENPIQAAKSGVVGLGNDVVNLTKALKNGESDDHSLGKLNDLGMKLGGIGIASYLFTRRNTPKAKVMEFAGAGVFFAMMNLWQKIFIATPLKLRFGVDINQKYIDSQGRRKELGQDNQYKPNLRTKEEKDQLADRMGLPKDMEFRGEYAEEKERRITLQGRTLNMLTAGVATPVMTALICNQIEKYIDTPLTKYELDKAGEKAKHIRDVANKKAANPLYAKKNEEILKSVMKNPGAVDDAMFKKLADALNPATMVENGKFTKNMPDFSPKIAQDLKAMFAYSMDENAASKDMFNLFLEHAKKEGDNIVVKAVDRTVKGGITEVSIDKKQLQDAIKNVVEKVQKGEIEYTANGIMDAISNDKALLKTVEYTKTSLDKSVVSALKNQRVMELRQQGMAKDAALKLVEGGKDSVFNKMIQDANALSGSNVKASKELKAIPADLVSKDGKKVFADFVEGLKQKQLPAYLNNVEKNFQTSRKFGATLSTIDDIVKSVDNSFGRQYFNIVERVFDVMKPSSKELEKLRSNSDYAADYLQKSLAEIAGDKGKYKELFTSITETPLISDKERTKLINNLLEQSKAKLHTTSTGYHPSLKTLIAMTNKDAAKVSGVYADIQRYVNESLPGIDATKNRILLALDLESRIKEGEQGVGIYSKKGWNAYKKTHPEVKESLETFIEDSRKILYKSTPGDFENTHYIKGNGAYYEALNHGMFNEPLSENTQAILKKVPKRMKELPQKLEEMRVSLMAIGSKGSGLKRANGDTRYVSDYVNTSNFVDGNIIKDEKLRGIFYKAAAENDAIKYQKVGKPLRSFAFENASQKFNSKAWMKIFAPIAIGLVGVTFLAQIFIGRDKDQHLYMKKDANSGAVNGNK